MEWLSWIAVGVLILASYFAALHLALLGTSRSALQRRCGDREDLVAWIDEHRRTTTVTLSLLQAILRLTFICLVIVVQTGLDLPEPPPVEITGVIVAGLIAACLLWLAIGVIAPALARHVGAGLLVIATPLLRPLAAIGRPLGAVAAFLDEVVRRLAGNTDEMSDEAREAELLASIEESQLRGDLDEDAAEMLENVVEFRSTDVGEVMTPRTDIDGIEMTDDLAVIREVIMQIGHSRIPVYQDNLDNIIGILYVKDLVSYLGRDVQAFALDELLRQPIRVPETKPVNELLADFQTSEVHMAIVIDEYGGTTGLVTIEDVLEELVGEIHDEHEPDDEEDPTFTTIDDTRAEVDGRFHVDDLNEAFALELPEDDEYDTIGGFILAEIGRVPEVGETHDSHGVRFTIIEGTPTQITRIAIERVESGHEDDVASSGNGERKKRNGKKRSGDAAA